MERAGLFFFLAFLSTWITALDARAFTPTVTPNGAPVRWRGEIKLNLAGNPGNQLGISDNDFYSAVVRGLQRWNAASGGSVRFDYWQGTNNAVFEPNSDFNGLSSIYFASHENGKTRLSPNVLGLTQVWYDTGSGEILETDIVLNDRDFQFTTNPRDTSGFGTGGSSGFGSRSRVFIENVITHELGHSFGLSHSGSLQATMLFMESPEQAYLGCDEAIGIRALYPSGDGGSRGTISGAVVSESGAGVFGAHVLAISRRRGTVLASTITNRDGSYAISALEPGSYFLMVEPFYAGPGPLPVYYSDIRNTFCPGNRPFGRSLLTDSSGYRLQAIGVGPGQNAGAPTLVARCASGSGASIGSISSSSQISSAPQIFDGFADSGGFGALDKFSFSNTTYYKLKNLTGSVEIHALSYSLYSPTRASVSLVNSNGSTVGAQVFDYSYQGASGYVNFDTYLIATNLPLGDYYVRVSGSPLDASLYPAGPVSLDSQPFLVVTGSVNEGTPPLAGSLATNARCRINESFANYQSPAGLPPRRSDSKDDGGGGFCGSTRHMGNGSGGSGGSDGGLGAGAIAGWFAPWLLMGLIAQLAARSARRQKLLST